jgi:hypothetical protein
MIFPGYFTGSRNLSESLSADSIYWNEWRLCYRGGKEFLDFYLQQYADRETAAEFAARAAVTPIPAFAKREINSVRNAVARRMPDVTRVGGSAKWARSVVGESRGVDQGGTSMNSYVVSSLLSELLVMSAVGVLIDAPAAGPNATADGQFSPYLVRYTVEQISELHPAPPGSPGEWSVVSVSKSVPVLTDDKSVEYQEILYRYYLDPDRGGLVTVTTYVDGAETSRTETAMVEIPFVLITIGDSLIRDVCSHQIALLNMGSADTNYAINSNFAFLTRQRSNQAGGAHLTGSDDAAKVTAKKGLWYDKTLERPGFISPPADPLNASLSLRKEVKQEIKDLVSGALADLGASGTPESGLAAIGDALESAEQKIWKHWTQFESSSPSNRKVVTVNYPDSWALKSDSDRLKDASDLLQLMQHLPGQLGKKEAARLAYIKLLHGSTSTKTLQEILDEVDSAPYSTSDPDVIIRAKQFGLVGADTGSLALGFSPGEAAKAEADQAKRAAAIVAAQTDAAAGAAMGADDLTVDQSSTVDARQQEVEESAGDQGDGQRGEGLESGD